MSLYRNLARPFATPPQKDTEFDAQFATICICLSQVIATAGEGNLNKIEECLKMVQEQVIKAMALLPQPMQDEIPALAQAAKTNTPARD